MAHDSNALETSIPTRGETLGCKTQQDNGEPMSQYYDSALQSTTPYYSTTMYYKVLLHASKLCQRTTKHYCDVTTYYSVLLRTT